MTLVPSLTIMDGTTAEAVATMFSIIFPDAATVLDATYGSGKFWGKQRESLSITGLDIDPSRAPDKVGDFTKLPYNDGAFDVVVFDPPYHTNMSKGTPSVMGSRFGSYPTVAHLYQAVTLGCQEAWRVARLGILVKVQNHIHGGVLVHMTRWVEDAVPSPLYDEMHLRQASKMIDPKWMRQLSIWRNHATFLSFRKGDQRHLFRGQNAED